MTKKPQKTRAAQAPRAKAVAPPAKPPRVAQAKPEAKRSTGPLPEFVGTGDLAALLGYTPRWVTTLVKEGVLEKEGYGSFHLARSLQAIMDYRTRLADQKAEETAGDKLKDTKRTELERKMAREERSLVTLDEATDCMDMLVGLVVEVFETLPAKVTRDQTERARLRGILDESRNKLSGRVEKIATDLAKGRRPSEAD